MAFTGRDGSPQTIGQNGEGVPAEHLFGRGQPQVRPSRGRSAGLRGAPRSAESDSASRIESVRLVGRHSGMLDHALRVADRGLGALARHRPHHAGQRHAFHPDRPARRDRGVLLRRACHRHLRLFSGFLSGARYTPLMIKRVGHVRVFAALGSFMSAGLIAFPLLTDPMGLDHAAHHRGLCHVGHLRGRGKLAQQCRHQREHAASCSRPT
jgi:hypothetical protein